MLVFQAEDNLIFSKINKNENNFEEVFSLTQISKFTINIIDINNDKILIIRFPNAIDIYDIKNKKQLSSVQCKMPFKDVFYLGEDYLLQICKDYLYILELSSLNKIAEINKTKKEDSKDWGIFKDHNEEWNIIYNKEWLKIKDKNIEFIKELDYNNYNFPSSLKYSNMGLY